MNYQDRLENLDQGWCLKVNLKLTLHLNFEHLHTLWGLQLADRVIVGIKLTKNIFFTFIKLYYNS